MVFTDKHLTINNSGAADYNSEPTFFKFSKSFDHKQTTWIHQNVFYFSVQLLSFASPTLPILFIVSIVPFNRRYLFKIASKKFELKLLFKLPSETWRWIIKRKCIDLSRTGLQEHLYFCVHSPSLDKDGFHGFA